MKRPPPLLVIAIAAALALIGWLVWRDTGAMVWLSTFIAYCF